MLKVISTTLAALTVCVTLTLLSGCSGSNNAPPSGKKVDRPTPPTVQAPSVPAGSDKQQSSGGGARTGS